VAKGGLLIIVVDLDDGIEADVIADEECIIPKLLH
jgi:hypothetical protein